MKAGRSNKIKEEEEGEKVVKTFSNSTKIERRLILRDED